MTSFIPQIITSLYFFLEYKKCKLLIFYFETMLITVINFMKLASKLVAIIIL